MEPTGPNTSNASVKSPSSTEFLITATPATGYNTNHACCSTVGQHRRMPNQVTTPHTLPATQKPPREIDILESIRDITKVLDGHVKLSTRNAEENTIQNATLLQQFIKSQDKRTLDPALMAIPTFSGNDRTKCLDWISRVKNVCKQSGQNFRQELVNKSELLVQNFITSLHNELTDAELIEKSSVSFRMFRPQHMHWRS